MKQLLRAVQKTTQEMAQGIVPLPWSISGWFGRLGNNIQQICCGILYAQRNHLRFISPRHELIDPIALACRPIDRFLPKWRNRFYFYPTDGHSIPDFQLPYDYICQEIRSTALSYVRPNFTFSVDEPLGDDELVVHIRGGDIFDRTLPPNGAYVQNPMSYFRKLISSFKRTTVVAEPGGLNPILKELECLPTVKIVSASVQADFELLLRARHLASSGVGTFAVAAALCSQNLKTFYCTDRYLTEHLNPEMLDGIDVRFLALPGYIDIGRWENSDAQRALMLSYEIGSADFRPLAPHGRQRRYRG